MEVRKQTPRVGRLHPDDQKVKRRQYTRDNRALWKDLGYRMMSTLVHDDDREEVLAEIEVRRCLKAYEMAMDKASNTATISHLSSRNITPAPTEKQMKEFLRSEDFKNVTNADEVEFCVEHAIVAKKRYQACINAQAHTEDGEPMWRLYAKQVANGNLAAAWWRLSQVRFQNGDKKSIFMARAE
jgi:hypothetical protein